MSNPFVMPFVFGPSPANGKPAMGLPWMTNEEYLAMPRHWRWLPMLLTAMAHRVLVRIFLDGDAVHYADGIFLP